jgi:hypothetical protein
MAGTITASASVCDMVERGGKRGKLWFPYRPTTAVIEHNATSLEATP